VIKKANYLGLPANKMSILSAPSSCLCPSAYLTGKS